MVLLGISKVLPRVMLLLLVQNFVTNLRLGFNALKSSKNCIKKKSQSSNFDRLIGRLAPVQICFQYSIASRTPLLVVGQTPSWVVTLLYVLTPLDLRWFASTKMLTSLLCIVSEDWRLWWCNIIKSEWAQNGPANVTSFDYVKNCILYSDEASVHRLFVARLRAGQTVSEFQFVCRWWRKVATSAIDFLI